MDFAAWRANRHPVPSSRPIRSETSSERSAFCFDDDENLLSVLDLGRVFFGRALGAVVSASRLHRVGRGFESLSAHQPSPAMQLKHH